LNEAQTRELRFVAQVGEEESAEFAVLATYHPDNTVSMQCKKVVAHEKGKKDHHHEVRTPVPPLSPSAWCRALRIHTHTQQESVAEFTVKGEVGPNGEVKASVGDETITGKCHLSLMSDIFIITDAHERIHRSNR
jgi:hypothetical protein